MEQEQQAQQQPEFTIEPHLRNHKPRFVPVIATEQKPPEAPAPEAKKEPQPTPPQTDYLAKIQELEFAKRDAETRARALEMEINSYKPVVEELKRDPYAVVQKYGGSIDDWSSRIINEGKPDPVKEISKEVQELRAWKEEQRKEKEEREQQQRQAEHQRQIDEFKQGISKTLGDGDEFKMLHFANLGDEVFGVIARHAQETAASGRPQIMPTTEAARIVQQKYEPVLKEMLKNLLTLPAFSDLATDSSSSYQSGDGLQRALSYETVMAGSVSQTPSNTERRKTKEELRKAAEAAFLNRRLP